MNHSKRYTSRLPVITFSSPVYEHKVLNVHPRLQLQARVTYHPAKAGEFKIHIKTFLLIYISDCASRNNLEQCIQREIEPLQDIMQMQLCIQQAEDALARAQQENDECLAGIDSTFHRKLSVFAQRKNTPIDQNPKARRSPKADNSRGRRNIKRQAEALEKLRKELDDALLEHDNAFHDLPHSLSESTAYGNQSPSIPFLEQEIQHAKNAHALLVQETRNSPELAHRVLNEYLAERFAKPVPPDTRAKLQQFLTEGRCNIYELEDGFGSALDIKTDPRGIPVDANAVPITVNMQAIINAMQTGEVVSAEASFAFVPLSTEPNALVGSLYKGQYDLVVIPAHVLKTLMQLEDAWLDMLSQQLLARHDVQTPDPGEGSQEQQESGEGTTDDRREHPDTEPTQERISGTEYPTSDKGLPRFPSVTNET